MTFGSATERDGEARIFGATMGLFSAVDNLMTGLHSSLLVSGYGFFNVTNYS
jgi:hypothetical protein